MEESVRAGSLPVHASELVKKYGDVFALNGVSLMVDARETVALIGPNGAGKTTLLESLLGLRRPESGSIELFGIDAIANPKRMLSRIGVQLQETRLFPRATVRSYLRLFSGLFERNVDLDQLVDWLSLDGFLDTRTGNLSGGLRQRLSLALALVNDPDLVILDEPTVGLDPIARQDFWELIRTLQDDGKSLLFSTHYMQEASELSDKIVMIHDGRVVYSGTPAEAARIAGETEGSLDSAYRHFVKRAQDPVQ